MKKITAIILLVSVLVFGAGYTFASEALDALQTEVHKDVLDLAPESVRNHLSNEPSVFTPQSFLSVLSDEIGDYAAAMKTPTRIFTTVLAYSLAYSVLSSVEGADKNSAIKVCIGAASSLTVCSSIFHLIELAESTINAGHRFILGFVPIFAGLTAAHGGTMSSGVYAAAMTGTSTFISETLSSVIKPLVCVMIALSLVCGVYDNGISSLISAIRKTTVTALGIATTVFLALMKLQILTVSKTDSLAFRTSRFFVSSAIPVIGSSANDAVSAVAGGLAVIKNSSGMIGIISLCAVFLPPLIQCVLTAGAMYFSSVAAELFSASATVKSIRMLKSSTDVLTSVIALYFILAVCCTAIMMNFGA